MYKILIDLDVITVAFWKGNKKGIALDFLKRVKNEEFYIITPFSLLELLLEWKNTKLREEIKNFYLINSEEIINEKEVYSKFDKIPNILQIIDNIIEHGIKDEDVLLVVITSLFNIDYLITFNRKHLKNNKDKINEVLKKNGLRTIKIVEPNDI